MDFKALDRRVEVVREAWQIPGMAVAVVGTDRALYVCGYGVRSASGEAVDGDTLFMIGSVSKSIAAATVATYADSGELHWDDRIADVLDQGKERVGALSRVAGDGFVVRWNGSRNKPRPVAFELSSDDNPLAIVVTDVRFPRCGTATAVAKQ